MTDETKNAIATKELAREIYGVKVVTTGLREGVIARIEPARMPQNLLPGEERFWRLHRGSKK